MTYGKTVAVAIVGSRLDYANAVLYGAPFGTSSVCSVYRTLLPCRPRSLRCRPATAEAHLSVSEPDAVKAKRRRRKLERRWKKRAMMRIGAGIELHVGKQTGS